jgi:hypothetical protein
MADATLLMLMLMLTGPEKIPRYAILTDRKEEVEEGYHREMATTH